MAKLLEIPHAVPNKYYKMVFISSLQVKFVFKESKIKESEIERCIAFENQMLVCD